MKRLLMVVCLLSTAAWADPGAPAPAAPAAAIAEPAPQFTPDELRVLNQLIDLAVKANGLQVSEAGTILSKKIQLMLEPPKSEPPK